MLPHESCASSTRLEVWIFKSSILTFFLNQGWFEGHASSSSNMERSNHASTSFIAGSIAGLASRVVAAPLDVIKIRWQTNTRQSSFLSTILHIYRDDGLVGFYRGNLYGVLLYVSYGAIHFPCYEFVKEQLAGDHSKESVRSRMVAGMLSSCFTTVLTYPLDTIRSRRISTRQFHYKGLFKGVEVGIINEAPMAGTTFAIHEQLKDWGFTKSQAGFVAGFVSRLIYFPLDTIKRRLMNEGFLHVESNEAIVGNMTKTSFLQKAWRVAYYDVYLSSGLTGFYRGVLPAIMKTGFGYSVNFYVYETVVEMLNRRDGQHQ